jgi:hypothetical protein
VAATLREDKNILWASTKTTSFGYVHSNDKEKKVHYQA